MIPKVIRLALIVFLAVGQSVSSVELAEDVEIEKIQERLIGSKSLWRVWNEPEVYAIQIRELDSEGTIIWRACIITESLNQKQTYQFRILLKSLNKTSTNGDFTLRFSKALMRAREATTDGDRQAQIEELVLIAEEFRIYKLENIAVAIRNLESRSDSDEGRREENRLKGLQLELTGENGSTFVLTKVKSIFELETDESDLRELLAKVRDSISEINRKKWTFPSELRSDKNLPR